MEFFEFVFLLSVSVVMPLIVFRTLMEHKRKKLEIERGDGAGVSVGDLKRMLAEVVREANAPLVERIEALEDETLSPEHEEAFEDELSENRPAERTLGRRVRS